VFLTRSPGDLYKETTAEWLAELDEARQAKEMARSKSILIAAWIAAVGTIVGLILMFALWDHPRH
jgi:hypothetical protein